MRASPKRDDETQDAYVIRLIQEEERERCAKIAETLKTMKCNLPTGPNGEFEYEHPTIHGQLIAEAIRKRSS